MPPLVLVIEDDTTTMKVVMQALLRAGLRVRPAGNALQAVALARQERPDLILADLGLPGLGGSTLIQAFKDDPDLAEVPVIIMSGDVGIYGAMVECGAADAIPKPFPPRDLTARVCRLVTPKEAP